MKREVAALRVAVVGCGSIGSRHARNLRTLGVAHVALCDLDAKRAATLAAELGDAPVTTDLDALLGGHRPEIVLVCTPPASHLAVARRAIEAGAHVFCEKPLAPSLDGVDDLVARAAARQRVLMMGMCYRFHAGLRRVRRRLGKRVVGRVLTGQLWAGQFLPDWHPWADYRREYSAQRRLGGGVLLDSIHAFDTVRWLLGEPVEVIGMVAKVSDLQIDTEDVASAILRLAGGAVVQVHVDYLQRHGQHRLEIVGSEGTLVWDFQRQTIRVGRAGVPEWEEEPVPVDVNEMYVAELRELLGCVTRGRRPSPDGVEGRATLAVACAVRESAGSGRMVELTRPGAPQMARVVA